MTRLELVDLYKKIENLPIKNYNKYLLLSIMKTKNILKLEIDKIIDKERELQTDVKFNEFEQKRITVVRSYSEKNEDGTYKIQNDQYIILPENMTAAQNKIDDLKKEYSDILAQRNIKIEEYTNFINDIVDANIEKTSFDNLPSDMTPEEFKFLSNFVKED